MKKKLMGWKCEKYHKMTKGDEQRFRSGDRDDSIRSPNIYQNEYQMEKIVRMEVVFRGKKRGISRNRDMVKNPQILSGMYSEHIHALLATW